MTTSEAERQAMRRALELAVTPGVPLGPNPRVGCVLLAPDGTTLAEGFHRGAGTPQPAAPGGTTGHRRLSGATAPDLPARPPAPASGPRRPRRRSP